MQQSKYNIFKHTPAATYSIVREAIIHMVLATDMSQHFVKLGLLKTKDEEWLKQELSREDRLLIMSMVVHAADVSNPCRPLPLYLQWTDKVIQEFFAQGDREKALGLPISPLMNRGTTNIARSQCGFIDVIIAPLYNAMSEIIPQMRECVAHMRYNKDFWSSMSVLSIREEEMRKGTQKLPPLPDDFAASAVLKVHMKLPRTRTQLRHKEKQRTLRDIH
uniref:PDEase domain-containing protein n=2 Tax=Vitrella brassicaformis TaxID=1169539 RepID=A0A6U4BX42_9ALVE|mmetsp:Transcript_22432/g.55262  ORF Transcript_22432/g.55262 Transcript_22432/m.55262 type:complete len:219 (+) Transcript_22432:407-1063(+)